jgi:NADH-ubiquinone oxidoreductase chain 5
MYLLIIYLPLVGSISAGLLGRKIGTSGSQFVTIACLAISSFLSLLAFYEVALCASPVTINLGYWINSNLLTIKWLFLFDSVSVTMLSIVSVVSFFIHIYSIYYMSGEPHQQRFFSFLSLFTFFMLVLVAGGNYLVLFLGWEGIGVSSYLLINYYYTRIASNKAAILAFNQNRVGDWILSVSFLMIITVFGSLDFDIIFSLAPSINPNLITIICILLFIGAGAKSAVIGLHSWLPGSMEAPTPVSSLLHAATLVTAGVYLLIRSSSLLEFSPSTLFFITIMGALTTIFAATSGAYWFRKSIFVP